VSWSRVREKRDSGVFAGIKFGMMVMKILVAMVIRKFKVSSATKSIEDIELTANIVLKPKRGFRLAFELR
jgi:hypothetical protein